MSKIPISKRSQSSEIDLDAIKKLNEQNKKYDLNKLLKEQEQEQDELNELLEKQRDELNKLLENTRNKQKERYRLG